MLEGVLLILVEICFFCYCSIFFDLLINVKNLLDEDLLKLIMDMIDIILNDKKICLILGDRM